MWQTKNGQVSFRVTEESDADEINEIAKTLQSEFGVFQNGLNFTKALINKYKQLENDLKTAENDLISAETELKSRFEDTENKLRSRIEAAENEVKQLREQLAAANDLPAPAPEVKEVPALVGENQLLITLTENPTRQRAILREIASRRASRYKTDPDTPEALAEKMIFNDGTIFNLGGEFYTGF